MVLDVAVPPWDVIRTSIVERGGSNLSVDHPQCMVPGLSSCPREDIDAIRSATGQIQWLGQVVTEASKAFTGNAAARNSLIAAQGDARLVLVNDVLPDADQPFRLLESRTAARSIGTALSDPTSATCSVAWGPGPGLARDLLSPAAMVVMCWLGPKYSQPLLDFAFAFASSAKQFKMTFLSCPAQSDMLDLISVTKRAATLRSSPAVANPGAALVSLAKVAAAHLEDIVHAVYHSFTSKAICLTPVSHLIPPVNVSELVKSEAVQYRDCTSSAVAQVQSHLPTKSSLPDVEPNFEDDRSVSWFRNAEYTFKSISFPSFHGLRGDQLSELRWHKYQSDVLHARQNCSHLSERQIIQHLMSTSERSEQHFTVAQHAALKPHCTVRQWLETIRDFYFTNGQFRYNIERAWQSYNVDECTDFNDLMHHITEYYRLIFIDYPHMPGKQSQLDFACILFSKLQHLMLSTNASSISGTLVMFMPLSTLLAKFNDDLKPALHECKDKADSVASAFIEWAVGQLLQVRESANTIKRFHVDGSENRFDYARLKTPRKSSAPPAARKLVAAASVQPAPYNGYRVQHPRPSGPSPPSARPGHIPDLKEMCHTTSLPRFQAWIQEIKQDPRISIMPDFATALDKELAGGDTSLHFVLSHATDPLPTNVAATKLGCCQLLFKVHYLYQHKQCALCPQNKGPNKFEGLHKLTDCPVFNRIPAEPRERFLADVFNRNRQLVPIAPAHSQSGRPDKHKRERYDSARKGPDTPKRSRAEAPKHVR